MSARKGLKQRLQDGESIICAEGYMYEFERRCYLRAGIFTPEVVLDHPERVTSLHEEFVHAGSDVVEAFTYYAHRYKMGTIGREGDVEDLNLKALQLARDVAQKTGTLMAGSLCNTTMYDPQDSEAIAKIRAMFTEQIQWAVKGQSDYLIGETFNDFGEAKLALEVMKEHGNGLPIVITIAPYFLDVTSDGVPIPEALRQLEELGADVVGLNCGRGPQTMLPLLRECRKVCKGPLAALPVVFRTTEKEKSWQSLIDPLTGQRAYPLNLSPLQCTRTDIRNFAVEARHIGIQYTGLCCGSSSFYIREIAEAYGRKPPSSQYTPDLNHGIATGDMQRKSPLSKKIAAHFTGQKF